MTRPAWGRAAGVLLLLLLLPPALSGCAGPAEDGGEPGPATAVAPASPGALLLTQCAGFRASTPPMPNDLSPGRPPPGWEAPATQASILGLFGLECRRAAVGPFERGPLRLVADVHSNHEPPEACFDGAGEALILHSLFVDDADLAEHLATQWQVPALVADIQVAATALAGAGATETTWTWGEPGQPPSRVGVVDGGQAARSDIAFRFFWTAGEGIGRLDLGAEILRPSVSSVAHGEMREPTLMASLPGGGFAGPARPYGDFTADGQMRLYGDLGCGEALA